MSDDDPSAPHRADVGPADRYHLIGAAQFALRSALGHREHHRLLARGSEASWRRVP